MCKVLKGPLQGDIVFTLHQYNTLENSFYHYYTFKVTRNLKTMAINSFTSQNYFTLQAINIMHHLKIAVMVE